VDNFWNAAAFDGNNPNLSYLAGNSGRNVLFKPGTRQFDASLSRNIRIREGHTLQFRWESFNATNHPNWNAPATDPRNTATFGKVTLHAQCGRCSSLSNICSDESYRPALSPHLATGLQ
jgi:hypothetical protein